MYCNIQKKPLTETIKRWSVIIDFSGKKIYQFYVLADNLDSFNEYYNLLSDNLKLIKSGDLALEMRSTSLYNQILRRMPMSAENHSFTVKNFGDSWMERPEKDTYYRIRFGHDYDQELTEGKALKEAIKDFQGKIVLFTWINTNEEGMITTAIASQFKDGAVEPVDEIK